MLNWLELYREELMWASLVVALLVLGLSFYRWLILRWQSDANLRSYVELLNVSLEPNQLYLHVDVPSDQLLNVQLKHVDGGNTITVLHEEYQAKTGEIALEIELKSIQPGNYELEVHSAEHDIMRKLKLG